MPGVENFTPDVLWTTLYGIVALCILFMAVYKVYDAIRNEVERRKSKREATAPDLADKVSKKVIETLEPRFNEIEKNLNKDEIRLNNHDLLIANIQNSQKDTKDGLSTICRALLCMTANDDKFKDANDELTRYLTGRL